MSTQQNTSDQSSSTEVTTLKFWLIVFVVSAVISVISAVAGNQSILSNAGMVIASAMVVLKVSKR